MNVESASVGDVPLLVEQSNESNENEDPIQQVPQPQLEKTVNIDLESESNEAIACKIANIRENRQTAKRKLGVQAEKMVKRSKNKCPLKLVIVSSLVSPQWMLALLIHHVL